MAWHRVIIQLSDKQYRAIQGLRQEGYSIAAYVRALIDKDLQARATTKKKGR